MLLDNTKYSLNVCLSKLKNATYYQIFYFRITYVNALLKIDHKTFHNQLETSIASVSLIWFKKRDDNIKKMSIWNKY